MRRLALLIVLLAACQPTPTLTPFAAAPPPTQIVLLQQADTPLPTHTPKPLFASITPSPTPTITAQASDTSVPTLPPILTFSTSEPSVTGTPFPSWTPPPFDSQSQVPEHFLLDWPIPGRGPYTLNREYPYGGTENGQLQVHHGDDLINPMYTPIHAAADGTVIYAGSDLTVLFGPYNNYYGNLVVIQHDFLSPEGLPVFTLYGHMSQVIAQAGQRVRDGDEIGVVGATGIALGPHLHFEVRIGDPFSFATSRNPELWLRPLDNTGLLVGRVTDASGAPVYGATLDVQSSTQDLKAYSYGDTSVNSDPALGENFVLGNLAPDYYTVSVIDAEGLRFRETVYVFPNQITWLNVPLSP